MQWLWSKLGWFGRLKARFWIWVVMLVALVAGGGNVLRVVTHDEVAGHVVGLPELCRADCNKLGDRPRGVSSDPMDCAQLEARLAGVAACRPKRERYYAIRFQTRDGGAAIATLPAKDFSQPRAMGGSIRVLRDPKAAARIYAPPDGVDFAAAVVGIGLLYWLVLRRLARLFPSRAAKAKPRASVAEVPKTKAQAKTARDPVVKVKKPKQGRYIINGPIRTRRR